MIRRAGCNIHRKNKLQYFTFTNIKGNDMDGNARAFILQGPKTSQNDPLHEVYYRQAFYDNRI